MRFIEIAQYSRFLSGKPMPLVCPLLKLFKSYSNGVFSTLRFFSAALTTPRPIGYIGYCICQSFGCSLSAFGASCLSFVFENLAKEVLGQTVSSPVVLNVACTFQNGSGVKALIAELFYNKCKCRGLYSSNT